MMVDQIVVGYYWDGRNNYVIYSDEDGYTTMKKEKEDGHMDETSE